MGCSAHFELGISFGSTKNHQFSLQLVLALYAYCIAEKAPQNLNKQAKNVLAITFHPAVPKWNRCFFVNIFLHCQNYSLLSLFQGFCGSYILSRIICYVFLFLHFDFGILSKLDNEKRCF